MVIIFCFYIEILHTIKKKREAAPATVEKKTNEKEKISYIVYIRSTSSRRANPSVEPHTEKVEAKQLTNRQREKKLIDEQKSFVPKQITK